MVPLGKLHRSAPSPTPMGERILAFMTANYVTDMEEFAEGVVGIPLDVFRSWIYHDVSPDSLAVRPMLLCAEALGTNPEYLTCMTDDPRPAFALTYDESVLVQSFRDLDRPQDRERVIHLAIELASVNGPRAHSNSPFPKVPVRRKPPANEG